MSELRCMTTRRRDGHSPIYHLPSPSIHFDLGAEVTNYIAAKKRSSRATNVTRPAMLILVPRKQHHIRWNRCLLRFPDRNATECATQFRYARGNLLGGFVQNGYIANISTIDAYRIQSEYIDVLDLIISYTCVISISKSYVTIFPNLFKYRILKLYWVCSVMSMVYKRAPNIAWSREMFYGLFLVKYKCATTNGQPVK